MNCPTCKNPVTPQSSLCEWCGNKIISINGDENNIQQEGIINLTVSFEGTTNQGNWFLFDQDVKILCDERIVGSGSLKNGFHVEFKVDKTQPILILKRFPFRSQTIEIPKLEYGSNYEIIVSFNFLWGNFEKNPINIIKK